MKHTVLKFCGQCNLFLFFFQQAFIKLIKMYSKNIHVA